MWTPNNTRRPIHLVKSTIQSTIANEIIILHHKYDILCLFVYTCTACGHEQSAFKPIVLDGLELSNTTNPFLPLPIDTIETRGCCCARNFLFYSTFSTTNMPQNANITWNNPSPECLHSVEKEGCA